MTNKQWYNHYKGKANNSLYEEYIREYYRPFWEYLLKTIEINKFNTIHEVGCGIGSITKILAKRNNEIGLEFKCSDINPKLLILTNINIREIQPNTKLVNVLNPIPKTYYSDLIFSHGLLEHFSDENIMTIINHLNDSCKMHIHYIPTNKYKYKSVGDERLHHENHWIQRFKPNVTISFNKGYDLILVFYPNSTELSEAEEIIFTNQP